MGCRDSSICTSVKVKVSKLTASSYLFHTRKLFLLKTSHAMSFFHFFCSVHGFQKYIYGLCLFSTSSWRPVRTLSVTKWLYFSKSIRLSHWKQVGMPQIFIDLSFSQNTLATLLPRDNRPFNTISSPIIFSSHFPIFSLASTFIDREYICQQQFSLPLPPSLALLPIAPFHFTLLYVTGLHNPLPFYFILAHFT